MNYVNEFITTFILLSAYVLSLLSFVFLVIHFYKFSRSKSPQRFATKFLTVYCINLALLYLYVFSTLVPFWDLLVEYNEFTEWYMRLLMAVLKYLMAIDVCVCFRNTALYLERSTKSQNVKFVVYCILGAVLPLIFMSPSVYLVLLGRISDAFDVFFWVLISIRVSRTIPFVLALWYLRRASIDEANLCANFGLHLRLLVIMGGFSSILDTADLILLTMGLDKKLNMYFQNVVTAGYAVEGIVIAVCFTFKKDTFRSVARQARC